MNFTKEEYQTAEKINNEYLDYTKTAENIMTKEYWLECKAKPVDPLRASFDKFVENVSFKNMDDAFEWLKDCFPQLTQPPTAGLDVINEAIAVDKKMKLSYQNHEPTCERILEKHVAIKDRLESQAKGEA
jgi:hypothetical protein